MLQLILYISYALIAIAFIVNLLLTGVRPMKTLTWLLVIFLLPILGILLYLMFGLNRRKYKFYKLKKHQAEKDYLEQVNRFYVEIDKEIQKQPAEIQQHLKLTKLIIKNSKFLPCSGNQVTLLKDGLETFSSIIETINKAKEFIHLQYYIFDEGELAEQLAGIFERKIKEGVEVRLIYDSVGSRKLGRKFLRRLEKIGVQVYPFLPVRFPRFATTLNYRNHRKLVIVDGKIGFTGGINVSDKYLKGDPVLGTWYDMHLRLEGPIVNSLEIIFAVDWHFVSGEDGLLDWNYFPDQSAKGDSTVQIVASGPDSDFSSIRQEYFTLINQATDYVYIANSYVIPGEAILEALKTAALSGVEVRLLVPSKSDNALVKWSIRSYFEQLLFAGVKIYLYPKGFLHSKIVVSDDSVASIGTANLDIRSFEQNFEVNALIYDRDVAKKLKEIILEDCEKSIKLDLHNYLERSWKDRMKEGIAKIFSPIL